MPTRAFVLVALLSTMLAACLSSDEDVQPISTPTDAPMSTATAALAPSATASSTATSITGSPLEGTSWQLVELVGDPVDPAFGVTLTFEAGRFGGYSGCNSFGGEYAALDTGSFSIGVMEATEEGCPSPLFELNFEARYFEALSKSVRYFLDPPRLTLHAATDATLLLFEPLVDAAQIRPTSTPVSAEPTPTAPIAEYGNWEIYVMNADGSDQYRPAPSLAGESWPAWMPDGRLTFRSNRSGAEKLYAVDTDDSKLEELPVALASITSPVRWTPDGSQIYYASNFDGLEQLYVAEANGLNPRRITEIAGGTSYPDWSSDGSKAVFTNGSHGPAVIYSINTDGTGLQRLTFDQEATEESPVWSPDGTQIAFAHHPNEGQGGIFIMNSDGSDIRRPTTSESWVDNSPSWSPDGTRIAFGRLQDIWIINVDGTGLRQLTDSPYFDEGPAWSPDGSQIAFVSNRDGGQPVNCSFTVEYDLMVMESLDQLAWLSEAIFVGEVVEQFPSTFGTPDDRGGVESSHPIFTDYRVEVDDWIRGVPSSSVRLREHGGTIGECVQTYEDEPQIDVGSRVLFFARHHDSDPNLPPAVMVFGAGQGHWPVAANETAGNVWFPDYAGTPVDELAEMIRDILRQPEPDYIDLVPLEESPLAEQGR